MSKAMAKAAATKQSWRELGFQNGWTRCNCGCKAPPGYRSATKSAPLWFRIVLFFEDTLHKFNDHCDVAAEDVKIRKNGQVMSATAA